ncbi:hypothetical protein GCM10022226_39310 [Sphaerisporangium flaviroseum]|uniref:Uncharacterized protein n=1 Tax=Sphaerisporangium flaviroseum TaxID=509199 RepID=A0ABP7IBR4_9ACTN
MSDSPLNRHDPRWDLVVQRSTVDPAYRERLMSAPHEAPQEAGISADSTVDFTWLHDPGAS